MSASNLFGNRHNEMVGGLTGTTWEAPVVDYKRRCYVTANYTPDDKSVYSVSWDGSVEVGCLSDPG